MPESIVEWKPRPRNRVFIRLSGGRFFTVPESRTPPLSAGMELSDQDIEQLTRIDEYARGEAKAMRLLSIRPRTKQEISKAFESMGLSRSVRVGIMHDLEARGLIDDAKFAREFVRNRVELRQMGPHRLRFDLKRLGVHESIVDRVLDDEVTESTQETAAREIIRKKLGQRRPTEGDVRRLGAQLRRRGIDYEIINRLMYDLLQRVERRSED
jgi:regulatory protein